MNAAPSGVMPVMFENPSSAKVNPNTKSQNKISFLTSSLVEKISVFTLRVFAELSVAFVANCLIMAFTAAPWSISFSIISIPIPTLFPSLAVITIITLFGVGARMYFESQFDDNKDNFDAIMPPIGEFLGRLSIVNSIGMSSLNICIHEGGHALAAMCCFLKPGIKIKWDWFGEGNTSFAASYGLTKFGALFGKERAVMLYRAAGLISTTVFAMIEIGAAFHCKDSCPQLSLTLICHAISLIANDVLYGLAALASRGFDVRNDYVALWWINGIHPAIPMIAMVALPIIEYCALRYLCS